MLLESIGLAKKVRSGFLNELFGQSNIKNTKVKLFETTRFLILIPCCSHHTQVLIRSLLSFIYNA